MFCFNKIMITKIMSKCHLMMLILYSFVYEVLHSVLVVIILPHSLTIHYLT